MAWLVAAPQSQ